MAEEKNTLFGWSFKRKGSENKKPVSFASDNEDGAFEISPTGGYFGQYMDLQGDKFQNDKDLIMKYRQISSYPEVDMAIEDICNEAICEEHGVIVKLNLDTLKTSNGIEDLIQAEFKNILNISNYQFKVVIFLYFCKKISKNAHKI